MFHSFTNQEFEKLEIDLSENKFILDGKDISTSCTSILLSITPFEINANFQMEEQQKEKELASTIFEDEEGIKQITSDEYEVIIETKDSHAGESKNYGDSANPITKEEFLNHQKFAKKISNPTK